MEDKLQIVTEEVIESLSGYVIRVSNGGGLGNEVLVLPEVAKIVLSYTTNPRNFRIEPKVNTDIKLSVTSSEVAKQITEGIKEITKEF